MVQESVVTLGDANLRNDAATRAMRRLYTVDADGKYNDCEFTVYLLQWRNLYS
jgi:hypothetical protein